MKEWRLQGDDMKEIQNAHVLDWISYNARMNHKAFVRRKLLIPVTLVMILWFLVLTVMLVYQKYQSWEQFEQQVQRDQVIDQVTK